MKPSPPNLLPAEQQRHLWRTLLKGMPLAMLRQVDQLHTEAEAFVDSSRTKLNAATNPHLFKEYTTRLATLRESHAIVRAHLLSAQSAASVSVPSVSSVVKSGGPQ